MNGNARPFFIIGSGRSGSTLLRRILCAHPAVHIPPETYVLGPAIGLWETTEGQPWTARVGLLLDLFERHPEFDTFGISLSSLRNRLVGEGSPPANRLRDVLTAFYLDHARQSGKRPHAFGDKTPLNTFHLDALHRTFDDARYIHIVRDGVDAAASYVAAGIYGDLSAAAQRWTRSVSLARDFHERNVAPCIEVRYEELVSTPEPVTRQVCAFLGVTFIPGMLASEHIATTLGDVPLRRHHARVLEPITAGRVGAARRTLSASEKALIGFHSNAALARFGYREAEA